MQKTEVKNKIWQKDLDNLAKEKIFEDFSNQSILITGATGLIGSELVFAFLCANRLKNLNIKIYALVRNKKKANQLFSNVLNNPNLKIITQNILKPIKLKDKIDYIIHCANITDSKTMVEKPTEVIETTLIGTKNILDFAKENNIKDTLYLSSIEVYGANQDLKKGITELDYFPLDSKNIRNCYPLSKKLAENLYISYSSEFGINVKIARPTQTFGAGIDKKDNRVFAQFAKNIISNQDIILKTDGLSTKTYCYITDTITALLTILKKGKNQEIYNISNKNTLISIKDLALKLISTYNSSSLKFEINNNSCYPQNSFLNINSQKLEKLGWRATVDLKEMFDILIEYLKEENKIEF